MEKTIVTLRKGEGRTLRNGGTWIYDNEISAISGAYSNGDIVEVQDYFERYLGKGFINDNSKIRVRILTRNQQEIVNADFWHLRLVEAWEYRKKVIDTNACRIVFADADKIPGLVVDKYGDVLVVQAETLGIDLIKEALINDLKAILAKDGISIRGVYERSDAKVRTLEGLERIKGFIGEPFDTKVQILENGLKINVDIVEGQKTGYFLDQKLNRLAIRNLCKGAKVLDCFTHTGGFALNAALGNAKEVIGVDASQLAVDQATENAKINNLNNVRFEQADVFELLPRLEKEGEMFDLIILDPPAFTKSASSLKNAMKGYREINLRAMKILKPGGFLVSCSCSEFLTPDLFTRVISEAAKDVHKRLRQVEYRTQAPDHPILWGNNMSWYLKFVILQVIDR